MPILLQCRYFQALTVSRLRLAGLSCRKLVSSCDAVLVIKAHRHVLPAVWDAGSFSDAVTHASKSSAPATLMSVLVVFQVHGGRHFEPACSALGRTSSCA